VLIFDFKDGGILIVALLREINGKSFSEDSRGFVKAGGYSSSLILKEREPSVLSRTTVTRSPVSSSGA
jgi:hypothetical protein